MNASGKGSIWIVDDDRSIRWVLERALGNAGFEVRSFADANQVLANLKLVQPQAIISDIRMPGMDGMELMETIHAQHPKLSIIIITAHSDLDAAVAAYQGGAFDYLPKPFDLDEAVELARRAIKRTQEEDLPRPEKAKISVTGIIGEAPAMQEVFRAIGRLARSHITVLITGESGTGKELIARALHQHSPRSSGPYIALNTAAIPRDLLESELFGHERGAFTGAQTLRHGRFEQADRGTLFLDEIGDMPLELQTRLLRVLADGEFYRVGGHSPIRVDVRIITATHQNLGQRVVEGLFREDLLHRLNVIRLRLPPLRERTEDIPLLLDYFLQQAAIELQTTPKHPLPEVTHFLMNYRWPGNVRELQNTCRRLTVMAAGNELCLEDLSPELRHPEPATVAALDWESPLALWAKRHIGTEEPLLNAVIPRLERLLIEIALQYTHYHRQEAAHLLGWGRNTLTRKMKELSMTDKESKNRDH